MRDSLTLCGRGAECVLGAFGKVYRGNVRGSPAAIKVLHQQTMDEDVMEEFVNEVQLMSAVHHRNVIACMGYALQPLAIVTELMHTSLEALFFPPPEASALSLTTKLRLLQDAALGVHWLHSLNPMIVHRDIVRCLASLLALPVTCALETAQLLGGCAHAYCGGGFWAVRRASQGREHVGQEGRDEGDGAVHGAGDSARA